MQVTRETPVGEIVAGDFRTAAVFNEYGIDFCCGGRRSLADVCQEQSLDADAVVKAIEQACGQPGSSPRFTEWEPEALIGYIVGNHHAYVRRALPSLLANSRKIATVHGGRHPELHEVAQLTDEVAAEMTSHMMKEEHMLFPFIEALAASAREGYPAPDAPFGSIENPLRMMEMEHESAGTAMARMRELTGGFTVPDDGCTTYRVCLQELQAFEADLHAHVHLENNVLFPKARALAVPVPS
jgi:regulator of cell morphogenesis and NO signaling